MDNYIITDEFYFALGWIKENVKHPHLISHSNLKALLEHMEKADAESKNGELITQ